MAADTRGCSRHVRSAEDTETECPTIHQLDRSVVAGTFDPLRRVGQVLTCYDLVTKKRNQSNDWLRLVPDVYGMLFDNQEDWARFWSCTRCNALRLIRT